ncbi:MAG: hypothetical protein ACRCVV_17500, partial [Shewanella sp.]
MNRLGRRLWDVSLAVAFIGLLSPLTVWAQFSAMPQFPPSAFAVSSDNTVFQDHHAAQRTQENGVNRPVNPNSAYAFGSYLGTGIYRVPDQN